MVVENLSFFGPNYGVPSRDDVSLKMCAMLLQWQDKENRRNFSFSKRKCQQTFFFQEFSQLISTLVDVIALNNAFNGWHIECIMEWISTYCEFE